MLIIKLCMVVLSHSQGFLEYHVRGMSMKVDVRIFSIVVGLNFEYNHYHGLLRF